MFSLNIRDWPCADTDGQNDMNRTESAEQKNMVKAC